ncbi:MAG: glycosyltransferase family 2 protein [Clostridia bacterium]|nr:glycosyltransferase family 2 protein [Clostridia bacterium]
MNYIQIVDLVFLIATTILGILTVHFAIFAIVGLFAKKKFPKTEKKLKYGVIIPARNEEKVIANLILSVQKNNYPQEKLQIFVIAHNCTDKTAEVARALGATVYEYNNPEECTMGYAFRYLFKQIEADYGTKNYDGFFLFNADNILDKDYFSKMNDAFVYYNGERVITSCRNSKNFGANVMSACYGLYFMQGCVLECRGRSVLGCSTRVQGTGYVISSKVVENGWNYVTLTEDWEFSADQVLQGRNIVYCDDAMFYDEQPTSNKIMLRQRLRWHKGHLLVFLTKTKELFKKLFKRSPKDKKPNKFSTYDIMVNIMPICVTTAAIFVFNWVFILLTPLFMSNYLEIWRTHLIDFGWTLLKGYLTILFIAILLFIWERKRIKDVPLMTKVLAALFFPIFLFVSIPLETICVFKKVGWKAIPHTDTTDFEKVNQKLVNQPDTAEPGTASTSEAQPETGTSTAN